VCVEESNRLLRKQKEPTSNTVWNSTCCCECDLQNSLRKVLKTSGNRRRWRVCRRGQSMKRMASAWRMNGASRELCSPSS
jgi:hypothetical protein